MSADDQNERKSLFEIIHISCGLFDSCLRHINFFLSRKIWLCELVAVGLL